MSEGDFCGGLFLLCLGRSRRAEPRGHDTQEVVVFPRYCFKSQRPEALRWYERNK